VLEPIRSGTVALHCVVPEATPACPTFVDQVTAVTPTLSVADPLKTMEAAAVEIEVDEGEVMLSDGGVVSVGVAAAWRFTVTVCETRAAPLVAVIVMLLEPVARDKAEIVQDDDPTAIPEVP
jgi:hypothetical protein